MSDYYEIMVSDELIPVQLGDDVMYVDVIDYLNVEQLNALAIKYNVNPGLEIRRLKESIRARIKGIYLDEPRGYGMTEAVLALISVGVCFMMLIIICTLLYIDLM